MLRTVAKAVLAATFLAVAPAANAATISIVSMQYSKAHPVPHFQYEGETVAGDVALLRELYDSFVHCRLECAIDGGRSTAVLTLDGPGGNYHEGLALADFLRANSIATVVERGAECYSACAFAFLGGTGVSSNERIGQYVDRMIEPGGTVGFHAPYRDEASLRAVLAERSPSEVLAENRDALSMMVKELVRWNVDPEIIHYMMNMGPDQLYNVLGADDYYLVRAALPPIPSGAWMTDIPSAIRNACIRLLALYERSDPLDLKDRITSDFEKGIGHNDIYGSLSGYRLGDGLLEIGHCSATDVSIARMKNLEIALYFNPGITGSSEPVLSFFDRDDYFSTAGIGASPLKRVFQRGGLGHWFMPVGVNVATIESTAGVLVLANKFFTISMPELAPLAPGFTEAIARSGSRISHSGNVWLFEQVGSTGLFDAVLADSLNGVTITHDSVSETGFIRSGSHADGTRFSVVGLTDGGSSMVMRTLLLNGGAEPTADESALLRQVQCGAAHGSASLAC